MIDRDRYNFSHDESARCPECGDTMTYVGESMRLFPPGSTVDLWVCDSNQSHRWMEVDGNFEPAP